MPSKEMGVPLAMESETCEADLIEPEERTCRAECFPPGHEDGLHNMVCSECGALVFGPVMPGDDRGSMFRFCPNCGARVAEG